MSHIEHGFPYVGPSSPNTHGPGTPIGVILPYGLVISIVLLMGGMFRLRGAARLRREREDEWRALLDRGVLLAKGTVLVQATRIEEDLVETSSGEKLRILPDRVRWEIGTRSFVFGDLRSEGDAGGGAFRGGDHRYLAPLGNRYLIFSELPAATGTSGFEVVRMGVLVGTLALPAFAWLAELRGTSGSSLLTLRDVAAGLWLLGAFFSLAFLAVPPDPGIDAPPKR